MLHQSADVSSNCSFINTEGSVHTDDTGLRHSVCRAGKCTNHVYISLREPWIELGIDHRQPDGCSNVHVPTSVNTVDL